MIQELEAKQFWSWFIQHKTEFENIGELPKQQINERFDQLFSELRKVHDKLAVEIGGSKTRQPYELIITAEGIKSFFADAELLVKYAPIVEGWKIIALKPAIGNNFSFKQNGIEINPDAITFVPVQDEDFPDAVSIKIIHPQYNPKDEATNNIIVFGIYAALDSLLGEKSTTLDIQSLAFSSYPAKEEKPLPITELPNYIQWKKKERAIDGIRFPTEQNTTLLEGKREGKPVIITANTELNFYCFKQEFPWLLCIEFSFKGVNENGFPVETMDDLYTMEDNIIHYLQQQQCGHHAFSETYNGKRIMAFYMIDKIYIQKIIDLVKENSYEYEYNITIQFDPYWVETCQFIK